MPMSYRYVSRVAVFLATVNCNMSPMLAQSSGLRASHFESTHRNLDEDDILLCRVIVMDTEYEVDDAHPFDDGPPEQSFDCLPMNQGVLDGDMMTYDLSLPEDFVRSHSGLLELGEMTSISIPGGRIENSAVVYPNDAQITVVPHSRRLMATDPRYRHQGNFTMLVVTGRSLDSQLSVSTDLIRDRVFHPEHLSLVSQMNRCSFGRVNIAPAQGDGIVDGVLEVDLDFNISSVSSPRDVERVMVAEVQARFQSETNFDFVLYCVPPGTSGWIAYGFFNYPRSVYNDAWCSELSTLLHEIGHNMNLHHAGEAETGYGDTTGYMGASVRFRTLGPARCFNAQKNWYMQWYQDRSTEIDIHQGEWMGRLVGVVEYALADPTEYQYILIKVGELYLQYNRAKYFNFQTGERANHVTIVYAPQDFGQSTLLASVSDMHSTVPSTFRYANFLSSGFDLVIEVCEQTAGPPDYARLSIFLDDGVQETTCDAIMLPMPSEPTGVPSVAPSPPPSSAPSKPSTTSVAPSTPTCEDTLGYVPISPTFSTNCYALSQNEGMMSVVCVPGHAAYELCSDTCGACTDNCIDSHDATFYVSPRFGRRNCAWLWFRPLWQGLLCVEGHDAYSQCRDTCDTCDLYPTPTTAPSTMTLSSTCDDSKDKTFYIDKNRGRKPCNWLARAPRWQELLCVEGHEAYDTCPETCEKCTDDCDDLLEETFYVNRVQQFRDCAWLSTRPFWQAQVCHEGHRAFEVCRESCDVCG